MAVALVVASALLLTPTLFPASTRSPSHSSHPTSSTCDTPSVVNHTRPLLQLLDIMNATGADFTSTFRALMLVDIGGRELKEAAARFRAAGLGIEVQDQQPQRPVTDDGGANSINKKARSTNDSAASASVSITPTREQHNDNVGDPASAAPSSASAAAAQASAGPLVDPGLDTVLDTIMASCASAAEIAESKKPRTSWEKLHVSFGCGSVDVRSNCWPCVMRR